MIIFISCLIAKELANKKVLRFKRLITVKLDIVKDAMTVWMMNRDQHYFKICKVQIWNPLLTAHLKIIFKVLLETLQTFSTTRQSSQEKRSIQIFCYQWTWTLFLTSLSCQNWIYQFSINQIWISAASVTIFSFPTNLFSKLRKSKLKRSHQYCQRFENSKLRKMAKSILPLSQVLKKRTNCWTMKSKTCRCRKSSKTPRASSSSCVQVRKVLLSLSSLAKPYFRWKKDSWNKTKKK